MGSEIFWCWNLRAWSRPERLKQLWTLEPHSYQIGCYYIVNEYWPNWRIADSKHNFYVFDGPHWDDQLFRFVPSGSDGFFYIYNCLYTNDRIAKYGVGDGEISMYDGPRYRDQLWKLVPRFKAGFRTLEVFHFDNRQSTTSITRTVSVTTGLKRLSTSTIWSKTTYKAQAVNGSILGCCHRHL